jgi:hypothetical protein
VISLPSSVYSARDESLLASGTGQHTALGMASSLCPQQPTQPWRPLIDVHVSSEVLHSSRGPVLVTQVYGIDLALVSNLVSNPVVNETIVKLSGTASQVAWTASCAAFYAPPPQPASLRKQATLNDNTVSNSIELHSVHVTCLLMC